MENHWKGLGYWIFKADKKSTEELNKSSLCYKRQKDTWACIDFLREGIRTTEANLYNQQKNIVEQLETSIAGYQWHPLKCVQWEHDFGSAFWSYLPNSLKSYTLWKQRNGQVQNYIGFNLHFNRFHQLNIFTTFSHYVIHLITFLFCIKTITNGYPPSEGVHGVFSRIKRDAVLRHFSMIFF